VVIVDRREVQRVSKPAILTCAVAWLGLLVRPGLMHPYIHDIGFVSLSPGECWRMLLSMGPWGTILLSLFVMLAAMMPPALISPIIYIRSRSFASRRERSVLLFIAAYLTVWTAAALVLVLIQDAAMSLALQSYVVASGAFTVALVWQCCPIKQICLNRCHAHRELAAFGYEADRSATLLGLEHGLYCVGSCWALMLLTMLIPVGRLVTTAVTTVLIFADRIEQPRFPNWRWSGAGALIRLVMAQTKARLSNLRTA
jgi:predicted metal-binding membrane protein